MDLALSSNSHTLISCTQLSNFSSPKPLPKQFLGLRPPGPPRLRSSRGGGKCRKLRFQRDVSKAFVINASLDSNTGIVVVAVTALSALSLAYLNRHNLSPSRKRKKKASNEVFGFSGFDLSQLSRYISQNIIENLFSHAGDVHHGSSVVQENEELEGTVRGNGSVFEGKESRTEFQETILEGKVRENGLVFEGKERNTHFQEPMVVQDSVLVKMAEQPDASFLACNTFGYAVSTESEAVSLSPTAPIFPDAVNVLPLLFATEMSELTLERTTKEGEYDPVASEVILKIPPSESSERKELPIFSGIVEESVREDLYTFFQPKQNAARNSFSLDGLKAIRSHSSGLTSNKFPSLKVNAGLKEHRLSAQSPIQTADDSEREAPFSHNEGGSPNRNKNSGKSRGFSQENKKRNLVQNGHTKLTHQASQNGLHANDKDQLLEKLRSYNQFLRDGRLADCVDVLEDMESRDLLDMTKVYHAKFFKICKHQKAVKEAFHFCKLIPNPTLSTFNMLMSVCASSQDSEGAFEVLRLTQGAGLKADCKLYTTLISTCAKSGKVDTMFEVFHEMVNFGVEPNVHTYGALIDGCARAGQVAKAFGAYGILRVKNVKPDRVVFNALITACAQAGAVDRAFDVLAEMRAETHPIDPDHITIGALMKACANANHVDRAKEVYNMIHEYNIKGTPEVYTIAVSSCSQNGDWDFACRVYDDMTRKGVVPDEMFFSAMINVAGHAGMLDAAFDVLQKARIQGVKLGIMPYSSLMGACSNAKNWQKALELYEDIKFIKLKPTVATMNALITALCDGDNLPKAIEVLSEMRSFGLCPNTITYSILLVASERKDDIEVGLMLLSEAKKDSIPLSILMCKCIIGMCLRRYDKACTLGEPVSSIKSGRPLIENKWTSLALTVYRETITAGVVPTVELVSQVLGCLRLPSDASLKERLIENLGVTIDSSKSSNLCSLLDGFGEYDPRAFSLLEEAASLGIFPFVSFKESPIVVDAKKLEIHTAEVYLLTVFKGLKHRLAAGARLPNVTILLSMEKSQVRTPGGEKTINLAGRTGQSITALLRRLRLPYQGNESYGRIRINGISLKRWLQPKLESPFSGKPSELNLSQLRIGNEIVHQQRRIRTGNFSLDQ